MSKQQNIKKFQKLLFIVVLISCSFISYGQGEYRTDKWRFSDPKQFGFTVLATKFFDNNLGVAVGGSGGIARTTNGGAKWTYGPFTYPSQTGLKVLNTFNDVSFGNAATVYAVGNGGLMAKSTDAGVNWSFLTTPLFANARNINAVWFLNKDTGYIGGQWNTADSLPKLYFTRNGGSSWDSLAAPNVVGKTRVGLVNNPSYPPVDLNMDAKAKEIFRIIFVNANLGYVSGQSSPLFPAVPGVPNITFNSTTGVCTASTTSGLTTGAHAAALLWKFNNGTLTDYSLSKERMGYTGINTIPSLITCNTRFGNVSPQSQQYRAMNVYDDSTVVLMSSNNNNVVKVRMGRNDSTINVNTGLKENGKYDVLNFAGVSVFNPATSAQAVVFPPIPATQVLLASNPYFMKKASNGKLFASANFGLMWTSIDTGRNWRREFSLPQGRNYSAFATWAMDILPSGKFVTMGQGGVVADSIPGGTYNSTYVFVGSGGNKVDFVDCNNGIVTGGAGIAVTTNGGNSWINKDRPDFASNFYSINGFHYTRLNKSYFAVSNGTIYTSPDQGTTLDPYFTDFNIQMNDVVGFGTDTIYGLGYSQFSVLAASRRSAFFRSTNAGATWQTVTIVTSTPAAPPVPAFTAPTLSKFAFPSRNIGYAAGSRNGVYKTTDGGLTWASINPFPALNENIGGAFVSYTGVSAIDDNTVFVVGNMFSGTNIRRVYKTTNGGATWTDISGTINTQLPSGNQTNIIFSDANNGYVVGGNVMFVTNNSGASWTMEIAPHGNIHNALGFAPRAVPAGVPFANRKLFLGTISFGSGIPSIMEYGDTLSVNVNSNETIVGGCSVGASGSITINASGGIAPYTYSLGGGPFQASNTFTGLTSGNKVITVRDAFCGTITKTVLVDVKPSPIINAGPDKLIVDGDVVTLDGSGSTNPTSIAWSPIATIQSGATSYSATAKPRTTTDYTLTVTDPNGCVSTDLTTITVIPYCIKTMDAFTPNGDGINDRWLATTAAQCTKRVSVAVYNRYGSEVYRNENYRNDWDGTYKGKPVPDGTYYYINTYELVTGFKLTLKADVTILR